MEELKAKGFETFGVEFSSAAVATCRRKQLQVEEANLETLELPAGKFKTIVLSHVLEHLGNPVEILSRVKHGLADGGSIVICVPNVNSPMRTLFGSNWHGWDPPFHLVHYSPSSLKRVCENAGLRVTRIARRMIPDDLRRSLVLLEKRPKRHILVRIVAIPVLMGLSLLGFGSYLLLIAERPSETSGSGRTKF
jgi:SAM-dependent methyltransferase